ncbi:MAG TPA: SPOR domain-containing protein, partial [Quisquiliibacterium sp.]|nr:SPOR domain-containing protein [Quisquiliibacterium sp.]
MATRNSSAGKNGALDPALPQKKRARRRLVGAAAVCLLGAIVLPIVLDSEPRQTRDDVQVRIPSRETPLKEADDGAVQGVIGGGSSTEAPRPADARAQDARPAGAATAADAKPEPLAQAPGDSPADSPEPPALAAKSPAKAPAKLASADSGGGGAAGGASAETSGAPPSLSVPAAQGNVQARPEPGADAKPADARGGFLLQAGAFASEKGAIEQQARVRKAGLKAYTEKVNTSQGERIRV